ncbi:MAG: DUF1638 domain-containing protein [Gammaproteobacteria bacterium]|nr:DUF1638 domain-containing protein [Gammaproteobacteria bacterium]MDH4254960.1 DUF1638 domain-containing protein [Gammaproteobacteria bacterium]MDH5310225.1 DUF1638 domain-containing protein [Gammaproteobacteria bacterium]
MTHSILIIACGALARELVEVVRCNNWSHVKIQCLPADLHNTPIRIPRAVEEVIETYREQYPKIFVAYGDCGTGGQLDSVLEKYGIERLPGSHCYEFLAGTEVFNELAGEELGSFYLTDFVVRHFDRLVKYGLGIEAHPELLPLYFQHYKRVVYLAQDPTPELRHMARTQAEYLGLDFVERDTGMAPLDKAVSEQVVQWRS